MDLRYSAAKLAYEMGIGEYPDNRNKVGKMTISRWEAGVHVPEKKYLERFLNIQNQFDKAHV